MDVRLVRSDEWAPLREVRLRALADEPDAFGATHDATIGEPEAYWHGWITGEGRGGLGRTWVAEDRSGFRGMAAGLRRDGEADRVELLGMWVAPEARGSGVAGRLVAMVEAWARGLGVAHLILRVSDANPRAVAFYTKLGFRRTSRPPMPLRGSTTIRVHEMAIDLGPGGAGDGPTGADAASAETLADP